MSTQHIVTAAAVKVSIGSPSGNRIAQFLRRGDVLPEGVVDEQLQRLLDRSLIAVVDVEDAAEDAASSDAGTARAYPEGEPNADWSAKELDAYAAQKKFDIASAKTKPEKVAAIAAAAASA